jgi:hypothetical protein
MKNQSLKSICKLPRKKTQSILQNNVVCLQIKLDIEKTQYREQCMLQDY